MKKKEPIEMNSMQKGLQSLAMPKFADGGDVQPDPAAVAAFLQQQPNLALSGGAPVAPSQSDFDVKDVASNSAPVSTNGMTPSDSPGLNAQMLAAIRAQRAPQQPAPQAPAPMAPTPAPQSLQQTSQGLAGLPDTNPGIYQGVSANDRLALQQKLMAERNSPGAVIGQGLAGLGDAINNSYGHGNSQFLKTTQDNMAKNRAETLGGVDTAREQKLQDVQGPMAAQMSDPKSPIAMAMRKTLQSAGLQIPSGMPPSVMLQISGPLGELAMKQATLSVQQQQVNATQANQVAERHLQAAKDLQDRGIVRKAWEGATGDSAETQAMRDELHETGGKPQAPHGIPDLGSTFNGHKVLSVKRVS